MAQSSACVFHLLRSLAFVATPQVASAIPGIPAEPPLAEISLWASACGQRLFNTPNQGLSAGRLIHRVYKV